MKLLNLMPVFLIWVIPQLIFANVSLNGMFADHMVVQQKTNIPVWGWADPNEMIKIECSWGDVATTTANADSSWKAIQL